MTTDKERFEATAREIANGYGYLCADRMNDANRRMFADIIASALSAAFEDGRKARKQKDMDLLEGLKPITSDPILDAAKGALEQGIQTIRLSQ